MDLLLTDLTSLPDVDQLDRTGLPIPCVLYILHLYSVRYNVCELYSEHLTTFVNLRVNVLQKQLLYAGRVISYWENIYLEDVVCCGEV